MKQYTTIVADPPWAQPSGGPGGGGPSGWNRNRPSALPYPTMTLDEIKALTIPAAKDAHLYLWTTNRFLRDAYSVAEEWGFKPSTVLVWCKPPRGLGMGGAFTITTEFVLFCRRGSLPFKEKQERTWFEWRRHPHSRKPEAFLDLVERVSPGPYLEMFARRNRLGWDTWGNEALNHVTIEEAG